MKLGTFCTGAHPTVRWAVTMDEQARDLGLLHGRSDHELVRLSRTGDGAAFGAIMSRYNRRLYRTARGILRDDAEAEDALQEAFVRAYRALPEFREDAALATW